MTAKIARNLMPLNATVRDVMARLNEAVGVILFVDDGGQLQGVATDGDVRRAILNGRGLDTPAADFMIRQFTFGRDDAEPTANLALLTERVRHLPILDAEGRPVDLLTWANLWALPLIQPSLGGNESRYVNDCLATGWISSQGPYIEKFQSAFSEYMGGGKALCTSSCTTALHLALEALGIGAGDEVIVPDLTFGATANVVIHANATPVFVDIDPITWTIDPKAIAAAITPRTKAIIPVHLYGHPCDMGPIMELARQHNLKVIEDCAESLGAEYQGRKAGLIGDVGCFSFFANKVITTGEGGMAITRSPEVAAQMAILRDHGMTRERRYWHLHAGYNYRMTNLQAAIGLAQLERIEIFLKRREDLVRRYNTYLAGFPELELPTQAPWARNIYWLYSLAVRPERLGMTRDQFSAMLSERGIETRPVFQPLHGQPAYRSGIAHPCPVSADIAERGISLPTGNVMSGNDVDRVCDAITSILRTQRVYRAQSA